MMQKNKQEKRLEQPCRARLELFWLVDSFLILPESPVPTRARARQRSLALFFTHQVQLTPGGATKNGGDCPHLPAVGLGQALGEEEGAPLHLPALELPEGGLSRHPVLLGPVVRGFFRMFWQKTEAAECKTEASPRGGGRCSRAV